MAKNETEKKEYILQSPLGRKDESDGFLKGHAAVSPRYLIPCYYMQQKFCRVQSVGKTCDVREAQEADGSGFQRNIIFSDFRIRFIRLIFYFIIASTLSRWSQEIG